MFLLSRYYFFTINILLLMFFYSCLSLKNEQEMMNNNDSNNMQNEDYDLMGSLNIAENNFNNNLTGNSNLLYNQNYLDEDIDNYSFQGDNVDHVNNINNINDFNNIDNINNVKNINNINYFNNIDNFNNVNNINNIDNINNVNNINNINYFNNINNIDNINNVNNIKNINNVNKINNINYFYNIDNTINTNNTNNVNINKNHSLSNYSFNTQTNSLINNVNDNINSNANNNNFSDFWLEADSTIFSVCNSQFPLTNSVDLDNTIFNDFLNNNNIDYNFDFDSENYKKNDLLPNFDNLSDIYGTNNNVNTNSCSDNEKPGYDDIFDFDPENITTNLLPDLNNLSDTYVTNNNVNSIFSNNNETTDNSFDLLNFGFELNSSNTAPPIIPDPSINNSNIDIFQKFDKKKESTTNVNEKEIKTNVSHKLNCNNYPNPRDMNRSSKESSGLYCLQTKNKTKLYFQSKIEMIKYATNNNYFKCPECDTYFFSKPCCQAHYKKQHSKYNFACKFCNKIFFQSKDKTKHQLTCPEKNINAKPLKAFKCSHCFDYFAGRKNLNEHHKRFHFGRGIKFYNCEGCNEFFKLKKDYFSHVEEKPYCRNIFEKTRAEFKCNICLRSYLSKDKLIAHILKKH